jgi:hypothetical protein
MWSAPPGHKFFILQIPHGAFSVERWVRFFFAKRRKKLPVPPPQEAALSTLPALCERSEIVGTKGVPPD